MRTSITFTIADAKGQKSTFAIWTYNGQLLDEEGEADIYAWAQEYALALAPYLKGAIVDITASVHIDLPAGLKAVPDLDSDCEEGVLLTFQTFGKYKTQVRWATFNENEYALNAHNMVLDLNDPGIDNLMEFTISPGLIGNFNLDTSDWRGDRLSALVRSVDDWKKRRK